MRSVKCLLHTLITAVLLLTSGLVQSEQKVDMPHTDPKKTADSQAVNLKKIHAEINSTVWRAFKKAFESGNGKALNSLYGDQVLRVTPDGIDTTGAFKIANESKRQNSNQTELDFWIDSRQSTSTTSYQVGFFRVRTRNQEGEVHNHYGQFHIVLEKQRGQWKIVQDWDTDRIAGIPISEREFEQQPPENF